MYVFIYVFIDGNKKSYLHLNTVYTTVGKIGVNMKFVLFLKEAPFAHDGCIYPIEKLINIITV